MKEGEEPYKVVKARPKLSVPVEERVPLFLNVYGYWQTVGVVLEGVLIEHLGTLRPSGSR